MLKGLNLGKNSDGTGRETSFEREKRDKYEQEKHPERIFNNKWREGQEWLIYDDHSKIMTCKLWNDHDYLLQ